MAIDLQALLARVVGEVFDESVSVVLEDAGANRPKMYCARAYSPARGRSAHLYATYEWFELHISDLDVAVTVFDYDDDQLQKHEALRELGLVARAYLDGRGRIDSRKRFLRKRTNQLTLEVDGRQWKLGTHASVVPFP